MTLMRYLVIWLLFFNVADAAWAQDSPPLTPERFAAIAQRLDRSIPYMPMSPALHESLRSARISTWSFANSDTFRHIDTVEEAEARARQLRDWGYTHVILSGRHFRQSWLHTSEYATLLKNARLAAQACENHGLAIIDHNDYTLVFAQGMQRALEHPQWLSLDIRNGQPLRWYDISSQPFTQHVIETLQAFQAQVGVDGYMIDEVGIRPEGSGSAVARKQFYQDTGYRLPETADFDVLFNRESPLWRLWLYWRKKEVLAFRVRLIEAMQKTKRDLLWVDYSTAFTQPMVADLACDMALMPKVMNMPGFEGTNTVWPATFTLFAELRLRLPASQYFDRTPWAQFPCRSDAEWRYAAYYALATAHIPWFSSHEMGAAAPIFNWHAYPRLAALRKPRAEIGVVFSIATRDGPELAALLQMDASPGWAQTLTRRNIQFHALLDHLVEPDDLADLSCVIVPAVTALPEKLSHALLRFVEQGGVVLLSGAPATRDAYNFPTSSPLLSAVGLQTAELDENVGYDKVTVSGAKTLQVTVTDTGAKAMGLESGARPWSQAIGYRTEALGRSIDADVWVRDDAGRPRVWAVERGKGQLIYCSVLPGWAVTTKRVFRKRPFETRNTEQSRWLIEGMINHIVATQNPTRVEGAPGVLAASYGNETRCVTHLLNAQCAQPAPGTVIGDDQTEPRYASTPACRLIVKPGFTPQVARLIVPQQAQPIVLPIKSFEAGQYIIETPAGVWNDYAAIELLCDKPDDIKGDPS